MRVATLLLVAPLLLQGAAAVSVATPVPDPGIVSEFEDAALNLAGERLEAGTQGDASLDGTVDWAALWDDYIRSLYDQCMAASTPGLERCDVVLATGSGLDPLSIAASQPFTINDLAQFRPLVGELVVEPDGWGVVGTPTNFYATAETHTMPGELFDIPIEVRWTPTSYVFDYGDGTVETSDASGTAWRGTEESWTETSTSHAYAERVDVTASLTVVFTAEVDAGAGWFAVPGTLPVDAPSVDVKVFEVGTVLTNGDCMANPAAAGCG